MQSDRSKSTRWRRSSAIAAYPGFNSYLELSGDRMRFVIDAAIEHAAEVPKLQEYVRLMGEVLALRVPRGQCDGIDGDWAE